MSGTQSPALQRASLELNLGDCISDSPLFRAKLQRNEDQLEDLGWILDSLVKNSRTTLECAAKLADSLSSLAPSVRRLSEMEFFDREKSPSCLLGIIDFVDCTFSLHEQLIRELGQKLLIPLVQSLQDDLRTIRNQRKNQEKARERYENQVSKFASISRTKELPLVREDAFQLYESRQCYMELLLNYVGKINKFKLAADIFFTEKCITTTDRLFHFADIMKDMISLLNQPAHAMKSKLTSWQKQAKILSESAEQEIKELAKNSSAIFNPDAPYEQTCGASKEGYLYNRKQRGLAQIWKRAYVVIQGGKLSIYDSQTKHRGVIEKVFETEILLCEIKLPDVDRRYCFEIKTSWKSNVFQAESEQELRDWLRVIENAKNHALQEDPIHPFVISNSSFTSTSDYMPLNGAVENNSSRNPNWFLGDNAADVLNSYPAIWSADDHGRSFGKICLTPEALIYSSYSFGQNVEIKYTWKNLNAISFSHNGLFGKFKADDNAEVVLFVDSNFDIGLINFVLNNAKSKNPKMTSELRNAIASHDRGSGSLLTEAKNSVLAGEVDCQCSDHLENELINLVVPIPVDDLFKLLFSDKSPVFDSLHGQLRYKDVRYSEWKIDESAGRRIREVSLVIPIENPLAAVNVSSVKETQTIVMSDPENCYVVVHETYLSKDVPYGDSFKTVSKFCLTRCGPDTSRIRSFTGIEFLKSTMVKYIIKSSAAKGMSNYHRVLKESITEEVSKMRPDDAIIETSPVEIAAVKNSVGGGQRFSLIMSLILDSLRLLARPLKLHIFTIGRVLGLFSLLSVLLLMLFGGHSWLTLSDLASPNEGKDAYFINDFLMINWDDDPKLMDSRNLEEYFRLKKLLRRSKIISEILESSAYYDYHECIIKYGTYSLWLSDQVQACIRSNELQKFRHFADLLQKLTSLNLHESCTVN